MSRLEKMLELYKRHDDDEDLILMIAELRDEFLNHETVSDRLGHDISSETVCGPEHVVYYIAEFIEILEQQNKHYREALEDVINSRPLSPYGYRKIARQALEGESNG